MDGRMKGGACMLVLYIVHHGNQPGSTAGCLWDAVAPVGCLADRDSPPEVSMVHNVSVINTIRPNVHPAAVGGGGGLHCKSGGT